MCQVATPGELRSSKGDAQMKSLARAVSVLALLAVQLGGCGGTPGDSITPGAKPSQPITPGEPSVHRLLRPRTPPSSRSSNRRSRQWQASTPRGSPSGTPCRSTSRSATRRSRQPAWNLIQKSALALPSADQTILEKRGFVISETRRFPSFIYGCYQPCICRSAPLRVRRLHPLCGAPVRTTPCCCAWRCTR